MKRTFSVVLQKFSSELCPGVSFFRVLTLQILEMIFQCFSKAASIVGRNRTWLCISSPKIAKLAICHRWNAVNPVLTDLHKLERNCLVRL